MWLVGIGLTKWHCARAAVSFMCAETVFKAKVKNIPQIIFFHRKILYEKNEDWCLTVKPHCVKIYALKQLWHNVGMET